MSDLLSHEDGKEVKKCTSCTHIILGLSETGLCAFSDYTENNGGKQCGEPGGYLLLGAAALIYA